MDHRMTDHLQGQPLEHMITVNSVSGGKTSCYMAIHHPADVNIFACVCIDDPKCAPKDPALLRYCLDKLNGNFIASAEHDKTLRVMMQLEQLLGQEIVWVRGKSFDQLIREKQSLPNRLRRYCTSSMKIQPMFDYIYPRYGKVIKRIGFRGDEIDRIAAMKGNTSFKFPLSCFVASRYQRWGSVEWEHHEFPLLRTYHFQIIDFWRKAHPEFSFPDDSNCRGCFHKPLPLIRKNHLETPEQLEWFSEKEKQTGGFWNKSGQSYESAFSTQPQEEINFENFTLCNSGGCTD